MNRSTINIFKRSLAFVVFLLVATGADAQSNKRSDEDSLRSIVGEGILSRNARGVLHTSRLISDGAQQYQYLVDQVMPQYRPALLRVDGYFSTTCPIPKNGVARLGGGIESPVLELIRIAKRLGKLDDLHRRTHDIPDGDNAQQRRKLAILALVEITRGQIESAGKTCESFYDVVVDSKLPVAHRWPELLVLDATTRVPELHAISADISESLRSTGNALGTSPIAAHLQAAVARMKFKDSAPFGLWGPSSFANALSRGSGFPHASWHLSEGMLRGMVSHHIEYMHYQIPLTGNFEIESEISVAPNQNGIMFIGGQWIQVPGPTGMIRGDYGSNQPYLKFVPKPLPGLQRWIRYRTSVQDNQFTTWMNGREVDQREVKYAPWIAIRNNPGAHGQVRNLRITGQPTIPDAIYPCLEDVASWKDYQGNTAYMWATTNDHANGSMVGRRKDQPTIASTGSLLHYHRPILEDGEIEYEFLYKPGEYSAHPALERLVFVLNSDGVRLRWIDDGLHDQSLEFRESNVSSKPISESLFLKENDWNRVKLTFDGDQLKLAVNDIDVYTHKIVQAQRRLGLYYDANSSSLQVRNMVWTGDWPKALPPPLKQELAGERLECLVGLEEMEETSHIDFRKPIDATRFSTRVTNTDASVIAAGLHVVPNVVPNYTAYWLGDNRRYDGDFDAIVRFSALSGSANPGQADLTIRSIDEHGNHYGSSRNFRPGTEMVGMTTLILGKNNSKHWGFKHTGDETTSGALRILRRDDTIYSLIAHGDSDRYHLVQSLKLVDPTALMTLCVEANRSKAATIAVVLEELTIRSMPPGKQKWDRRVTILDKVTQSYDQVLLHDFSEPLNNENVSTGHATATEDGLQLRASQAPATVTCRHQTSGDFDVQIAVNELDLSADSSLAMKLDVGDDPTRVELAVQRGSDGDYDVIARSKTIDGETNELGSFSLSSVKTLQMTRLQKTIFFVCKSKTKSRVIGFCDVGLGGIRPGSLQLLLRSESTPATAQLTSLQIRSSKP